MNIWKTVLAGTLIVNLTGCGVDSTPASLFDGHQKDHFGVIYGEDSVQNVPKDNPNTQASVALIQVKDMAEALSKTGSVSVDQLYGTEGQLSWGRESHIAFCSGVVVADNMLLTAGHCLEGRSCEDILVSQDYTTSDSVGSALACEEIIQMKNSLELGLDYALIRVVGQFKPAKTRFSKQVVQDGDELYAIGYPLGSPRKLAQGKVRRTMEVPSLILTTLDVFEGNSGSPVYDSKTHELVGILSSGEPDFDIEAQAQGENKVLVCSEEGCMGEYVIPIQKILADIHKAL